MWNQTSWESHNVESYMLKKGLFKIEDRNIKKIYEDWCGKAVEDPDLKEELQKMNADAVEDAFYRALAFGTGGLRGIIGAGTNRMNIYTVRKATEGLAEYLKERYVNPSVAVSYDSRVKSRLFAETASGVLAANGIKVFMFPSLAPTPCLSFAVRACHCSAGVMITASHNPAEYNGYKVYGEDGCQITTDAAKAISEKIDSIDEFGVKNDSFSDAVNEGCVQYILPEVMDSFIAEVKKQSVLFDEETDHDFPVVYSPLNGTGLKPVRRILEEIGFLNIHVVKEQEEPDGSFLTCPYPNPEIAEAMKLGIRDCKKTKAELLLATDPDCDRCGIAVKDHSGEYRLLSGNETGVLLLDFICSQRTRHHVMPEHPVFIKTIVTTAMAERIAETYGVQTINTLTGFKYIGEQIGILEKQGRKEDYIFGFEESYGYLSGTYVRDKDAVNAALLITEMSAYYRSRGISLLDRMEELYQNYGYYKDSQYSFTFKGSFGVQKMKDIMTRLRGGLASIAGDEVVKTTDYSMGISALPKSDVLQFGLKSGSAVIVRPSGTEPKLKVYISAVGETGEAVREKETALSFAMKAITEG